jgi:hypothetical protein
MLSRAQAVLLLSGLVSCGAIAVAVALFAARDCASASACDDDAIAWVVGVPIGLLGVVMLIGAGLGWSRKPGLVAQASGIVWACVLLGAGAAIGGAANVLGILLAVLAVVMGALSVWVSG